MSSIWEQVEQEFSCSHDVETVVFYRASNDSKHYRRQCRRCGNTTVVRKFDLLPQDRIAATEQDESLKDNWWRQRTERSKALYEEQKATKNEEWWDNYNAYLLTPEWNNKRQRVLIRDNHTCQACLQAPADQVHHLTYANVGHEPLFDLVAICYACHVDITPRMQGQVTTI